MFIDTSLCIKKICTLHMLWFLVTEVENALSPAFTDVSVSPGPTIDMVNTVLMNCVTWQR